MQRSVVAKRVLASIIGALLATAAAVQIAHFAERRKEQAKIHEQRIAAFRNAWMADCLQHAPAFQCVAIWSQVDLNKFVE